MKFELIIILLSTVLFHARAIGGGGGDVSSTTKKNNHNQGHEGNEIEYDTTVNEGGLSVTIRRPLLPPGGGGNTHIITWNNEQHYKYDGQCDLVMMKDEVFAQGLGLHVHIRTKIVGYWSYIQSIAIQIGNDILEIEGSTTADEKQAQYWINYEYQGDLDTFAGFSVTQSVPSAYKRHYTIDLNPNASIVVQVYKEFVRVQFNGDKSVFGNTVGLLGDYMTGKTHARDGVTVIDDFTNRGDQWQVLPYEKRLFREASRPQFPEQCWKPKDPRGERRRHLANSEISYAQAELACFRVMSDPISIKDCVNDVLATQDLEMVGAYEQAVNEWSAWY
ncbi:unnamed protein product [Cylindrotheca closterium]|uniref:VWFD domain-containing protein n=1 Tax=Cylindrotheca closterium TaxID=2856 RepID=A0AAD2FFX6_9STRA|nr:unnamed protein product [Cylindrotheca closterium]